MLATALEAGIAAGYIALLWGVALYLWWLNR